MFAQKKQLNLERELGEIRLDIDRGHSSVAQKKIAAVLQQYRYDAETTARAKCLLGESLELQGRHAEAVENLQVYENGIGLKKLEFETQIRVRVRLALAYNYTGDFPKAIALLNSALRAFEDRKSDSASGSVYLALSRIYRTINEYRIARDHAEKALAHFRATGDWRGLAESYFAVALVELFEGEYEPALEHLQQVLKLVGDRPAAYLLGMTYTNLAAVCGFVRQPREGIAHLEKAISYYETTEHKTNAIAGYNNLGVHLTLSGDWRRAESEFKKALELAESTDARSAKLPMVLDSLGDLKILRGELKEARALLEKAVEIAEEHQNKWYEWQSLRTLGKCFLAEDNPQAALEKARKVLKIGEKIGDRQAVREAHLLIAEAFLNLGEFGECEKSLRFLRGETLQTQIDLGFVGELEGLQGMAAIYQNNEERARQFFGKSVSIFEMLGDRYRLAIAKFLLGKSLATSNAQHAKEFINEAIAEFATMGATPDLEKARSFAAQIGDLNHKAQTNAASLIHALVSRLTDSPPSRELLLHELASALRLETEAENILIFSRDAARKTRVIVRHGFAEAEFTQKIESGAINFEDRAENEDLFVHKFSADLENQIYLLIAPFSAAVLPGNLSLEPLLKIVENGLATFAARENPALRAERKDFPKIAENTEIPGFIYASPAMKNLVEEIRKIRSSDVTVLITGESGTGKELVAQSVHKLSARGDKSFIPFNCTAVPKDLADASLFGYRKGAFTGAATNSEGVIRAAAGGTLFLDEIGDLPLEIQPKLLRFLQEGEIQPLGESHQQKVDVRIVAATNADLEQMVADGTFREDLYYRLNIIRLHVPPLRMRRAEIPVLINHYAKIYAEKFNRRNIRFVPQTIDLLTVCDWHGNIRQLCNEIQRIIARSSDDSVITPDDISPELRPTTFVTPENPTNESFNYGNLPLHDAVEELEKTMIVSVLEQTGYNISQSARRLGITRRGLQLKLERYQLRKNQLSNSYF